MRIASFIFLCVLFCSVRFARTMIYSICITTCHVFAAVWEICAMEQSLIVRPTMRFAVVLHIIMFPLATVWGCDKWHQFLKPLAITFYLQLTLHYCHLWEHLNTITRKSSWLYALYRSGATSNCIKNVTTNDRDWNCIMWLTIRTCNSINQFKWMTATGWHTPNTCFSKWSLSVWLTNSNCNVNEIVQFTQLITHIFHAVSCNSQPNIHDNAFTFRFHSTDY